LVGHLGCKQDNRQEIDERRQVIQIKWNEAGIIFKGNIMKCGLLFQEIIEVFGHVKNHHYHRKNGQCKYECAQVLSDDVPVNNLQISS
jgi:hypothetical protein